MAVLDDLQWADAASQDLVDLTLRTRRDVPLLLIATVRTGTADATAASALLSRLARYDHVRRIDLGGLLTEDVEAYVDALGLDDIGSLGARVHARTSGNAFFVAETLRLLADQGGDLAGVPDTVVDVVRRRVDDLPDDGRALLAMASVAGSAFRVDLVRSACDMDVDAGLDALEPAVSAQLVVEDETGVGRFRFAHPIVQEAIYAALSPLAPPVSTDASPTRWQTPTPAGPERSRSPTTTTGRPPRGRRRGPPPTRNGRRRKRRRASRSRRPRPGGSVRSRSTPASPCRPAATSCSSSWVERSGWPATSSGARRSWPRR